MKTREEVVELFRNKYDYLKTVYPSVEAFDESAIKQNQDGGWQLSLSPYAAITLRPCDDEPHETHGAICDRWRIEGESAGKMGYPMSDEQNQNVTIPNTSPSSSQNGCPSEISVPGAFSDFEFGRIEWHAENTDYGIPQEVTVKMKEDSQRQVQTENSGQPEIALSGKTKNLLKRLDPIIRELENLSGKLKELCGKDECGDLQGGVTDIVRRRRAFDSKTFFMVTFGMLKAGKSTLVNTFVGEIVSPVGRAKETTLRSSIIMASDRDNKAGIYLYSPIVNAQSNEGDKVREWEKNNGIRLMDFLTGLTTKEEFLHSFKEEYIPFSEPVLERLLTSATVAEYPNMLPPVIRVNASGANKEFGPANLLKDGVAILDTPGLDGSKANKDSDPFLTSLMSYGDYFLLVQSSMSAINKDCRELIVHLYHETKNAPLLVVFNEIASNFWLKPEVEKEKLREDSETASQELAKQLRNELGGIVPEIISINAGEASDAVFGTENDNRKESGGMIEESRIRSLRDKIVKTLREERTAIKERNATDRMLKALEDTIKMIDESIRKVEKKEQGDSDDEKKRWDEKETAAANLVNAFLPNVSSASIGIKIAESFAETMKWYMGDGYKDAGEKGSPDGYSFSRKGPYKKSKGTPPKLKDNHDIRQADEELKKQEAAIGDVKKRFKDRFKKNFYHNDLLLENQPWARAREEAKEYLDKLRELANKVGVGADDEFFVKMFKGLNVDEILSDVGSDLHTEQITPVPFLCGNLTLDKNKVWECDCWEAFDRLATQIEYFFPDKAAAHVAERFKEAVRCKGEENARHWSESIHSGIDNEQASAAARKKAVEKKLDVLEVAKQKVEEMISIIGEA